MFAIFIFLREGEGFIGVTLGASPHSVRIHSHALKRTTNWQ
jgi:hypothetical protein